MVVLVFALGYALVGIPAHFARGPDSRDILGTIAGLFVALAYLTLLFSV